MLAAVLILMGTNQRWFAKDYYFSSKFPSADGLSTGMAIRFKGFQIGVVDSVSLNQDNSVGIRFHIYDTYIDKVTRNSVLELTTSPIGLGGGLSFHPGKVNSPHIPEGSYIPSTSSAEGQALVKQGLVEIPQNVDTITKLIGEVGPILQNVNTTLESMQELIANANTSISGRAPGSIGGTLSTAQDTVQNVNTVVAQMGQKISSILDNLNTVADEVKKASQSPQGVVQGLLKPTGSVSTILNDNNALYDNLNATLDSLNKTVKQLQEFVQYLNNTTPQISGILDQGRQTLVQGKDVLEGIRNNPLIRGGIPKQVAQPTTAAGYRGGGF
jgi:phospholipid/cholesterol/gamma-HCH transport system substrate-binding protein